MNEKNFKENLLLFCENFNFEMSPAYMKLLFKNLENAKISDGDFKEAVNQMILTKRKKDFYGRPAVADWLDILGKYKPERTVEDNSKIKATEVINWLEKNVFISDNYSFNPPRKYVDWTYIQKDHKFDDGLTNYVIEKNFRTVRGLIERFGEQKIAGYGGIFKKELIDMFRMGFYEPDKFVALADTTENVKIDKLVKNLGNKLKGTK